MSVPYTPASLRFTHGGTRLAVAAGNGSPVRLLHPATLVEESSFAAATHNVFALSDDGKLIATISTENILTVSEIDTGLPRLEIPLEESPDSRFAFLPDGKSIAVANRAGKVTLFRIAGGKPFLSFDHGGPIDGLVASGDGKRLATGGGSRDVEDLGSRPGCRGEEADRRDQGHEPASGLARDRPHRGREPRGSRRLRHHGEAVGRLRTGSCRSVGSFAGREAFLASTGTATLRLRIWELESGKEIHSENDRFPNVALLSPTSDGNSLFILAGDAAFHWSVGKREAVAAGRLPSTAIVAAASGGRLAVATPNDVLIYDDFDPKRSWEASRIAGSSNWRPGPGRWRFRPTAEEWPTRASPSAL